MSTNRRVDNTLGNNKKIKIFNINQDEQAETVQQINFSNTIQRLKVSYRRLHFMIPFLNKHN